MGIFGDDPEAEHVIATLAALGIETFKCKQYPGENGCPRVTVIDGERVFLGSNAGGIRKAIPYILDRTNLEYGCAPSTWCTPAATRTQRASCRRSKPPVSPFHSTSRTTPAQSLLHQSPRMSITPSSRSEICLEDAVEAKLKRLTGFGPRLAVACTAL